MILCLDGMPDFNALHSGKHNSEVHLCAFDVLAIDGEDIRHLPLSMRKTNLWIAFCVPGPMASSSTHLKREPLAPISSAPPATSG